MHDISDSWFKPRLRRHRVVALALLVVVVALGVGSASGAKSTTAGPPDTYVTSWDAVGTPGLHRRGADAGRGSHDLRLRRRSRSTTR